MQDNSTFQNIHQIADIDTDAELYTLTLNTRYAQLAAISTSSLTWNWYIDASTTNSGIVLELSPQSKQEVLEVLKSREEGRLSSRNEEDRLNSSNKEVRTNSSSLDSSNNSSSNTNQHFRFQKARKDSSQQTLRHHSSLSQISSTIFSTITLQPKETFETVRKEEREGNGVMMHHSVIFPVIISSLPFHQYDARVRKEADQTKQDSFIIKMRYVRSELQKMLAMFPPEHIYIEGSFVQPKFLHSSAITLKLHGFLVAELMDYGITYIPPKKIKKLVTDSGNASKELVQEALVEKYDGKELEELAFLQELDDDFSPHIIPVFSNFDESDALAVWCAKYMLEEK